MALSVPGYPQPHPPLKGYLFFYFPLDFSFVLNKTRVSLFRRSVGA